MDYDSGLLKEKVATIEVEKEFSEIDLSFFFDYQIFPKNIISGLGQWTLENREMQSSDTILQQACLPSVTQFSQKVIFAVRIKDIIIEPTKKGFSYETLK